jgi:hypothetical protein
MTKAYFRRVLIHHTRAKTIPLSHIPPERKRGAREAPDKVLTAPWQPRDIHPCTSKVSLKSKPDMQDLGYYAIIAA